MFPLIPRRRRRLDVALRGELTEPTQAALIFFLGGCPVAQLLVVGRAISGNSLLVTAKGALVVPGGVLPGVTKNTGLDGLPDQGLGVKLGEVDASAALDHAQTLQDRSSDVGVFV